MGCGNSKSTVEESQPAPGKLIAQPKFKGTSQVPLFNGMLYRIMNDNTGEWAFFSNTRDYEFHVKYLFGADSEVELLGDTTMERADDGIICEVHLYPLETKMFIKGKVDGFESKLEALPLSEEYFARHPELDEVAYMKRVEPPKASTF